MKHNGAITCILLLVAELTLGQNRVLDKRISSNSSNRTIQEILMSIRSEHGILFSWNSNIKALEEKKSIQAFNEPMESILLRLFKGTGLKFKEYLGHVIISKETTVSGFV